MALTKVASDGIEALAITNAHLHTVANIAHSKLADSGASAGSYGSSTAIPSITVNAKGTITSISQTSIDTDLLADTTPQLGGNLDANGKNINFGDSSGTGDDRLTFGAAGDLQIFHDGTNSFISDTGSGALRIVGSQLLVRNAADNENMIVASQNGSVELYYDGNKKLETQSSGIGITGNLAVSGTVDGRDLATDGSKLDGIEASATADQTASEILSLLSDQNIDTTGYIQIGGTSPSLYLTDSNNNPDYIVRNSNGTFVIRDGTVGADRLQIATDGHVDVTGNLDVGAGLDVTGNVAASGTIAANGGSIFVTGTSPAVFFTDTDNNPDYYLQDQNGTFRLVDNTNSTELFTANATTLVSKVNHDFSAGIDVTGAIVASGDITANGGDITISGTEAKLKFTDSDNNPDYILWNNNGVFRIYDNTNSTSRLVVNTDGHIDITGNLDVGAGLDVTGNITVTGTVDGRDVASDGSKLDGIESGATADQTASEILTLIKTVDGSGSGLDADTLDGISSASFVRSDADDTLNGQYTISDSADEKLILAGSSNPYIRFQEGTTNKAYIQFNSNGNFYFVNQETGEQVYIGSGGNGLKYVHDGTTSTVWHSGNDGSGSGLDADVVDGLQASSFLRSDSNDVCQYRIVFQNCATENEDTIATSTGSQGGIEIYNSGAGNDAFMAFHSGSDFAFYFGLDADINDLAVGGWSMGANKHRVWHAGNDGSGSGLDADLLDGQQGSYYSDYNNLSNKPTIPTNNNQLTNGAGYLTSSSTLNSSNLSGALPAIDGSNLTGVGGGVESGTVMLFYQANAPTGWTKSTSHNNKALRVVSGSGGGSGGGNNFTTAFNSSRGTSGGSVSNHTLTEAQIPSHRHRVDTYNEWSTSYGSYTSQGGYRQAHRGGTRYPPYTQNIGSGNAHNHGFSNPSINLNVQYVDVIICSKD